MLLCAGNPKNPICSQIWMRYAEKATYIPLHHRIYVTCAWIQVDFNFDYKPVMLEWLWDMLKSDSHSKSSYIFIITQVIENTFDWLPKKLNNLEQKWPDDIIFSISLSKMKQQRQNFKFQADGSGNIWLQSHWLRLSVATEVVL